ncbi:MAG: hypothetical protein IT364_02785 [Candidatus Hydrogenedentes bacterium]|nr:hypothetical protein [Candidatus Hydrogenedentota bacterium]
MTTRRGTFGALTVAQEGEEFCILHTGRPVATPMGNPTRTGIRTLAVEVAEDLARQGPDPGAGVNMYTCLCSFLDFGPIADKKGLIMNAFSAIPDHPVVHTSADAEIVLAQMAAYRQPHFEENGLRQMDVDEPIAWTAGEMSSWCVRNTSQWA